MTEEQSIGMMEGAFFVGKAELIAWVNSTLRTEVTRIEELGTGAVYCQLVDAMYPGKVAMARVNWRARNQWEFLTNLKVLQQSFLKCRIHKHIEVEKLAKCKYQDNLEFIQWLKRYFDLHNKNDLSTYDPIGARKNAVIDFASLRPPKPLPEVKEPALAKSKSPYDKVRSKINNRSVTLQKPGRGEGFYKGKLQRIREILEKGGKQGQQLHQIRAVMEMLDPIVSKQPPSLAKIEQTQSKPVIQAASKKKPKDKQQK